MASPDHNLYLFKLSYHLTRRGACDVILLDRLGLATAASSKATGLMFAISSKPAVDRLSRVTFKVIGALEEQLGDHLDFHRVGTVRLAETGKSRSALEALYARAQQEAFSPTFDYCILPDDMDTFTITEKGHEWDALIEAEPRVSSFFPGINNARFESYVAGLSAYTPDGHFTLGEIDERPGLYVAAGCCGSGVMSSGGIGEALAGLIIEGESPHNLMPL